MKDLKVYCTKDFYNRYLLTGHLIACSAGTRNNLLFEDRNKNKDLSVRLSLDRRKHKINKLEKIGKDEIFVEGKWFEIIKQ